MAVSFDMRVFIPDQILVRELGGESVLLNLNSGSYFGLDEVGTRMWSLLSTSPSIQAAYEALLDEYEVEPEQLRQDLNDLLEKLRDHGLIEING